MSQIERLKSARKKLNLTAEELGNKLSIPSRTIGGYERGERKFSVELVEGLTRLGISPLWLLTGQGSMFLSESQQDDGDTLTIYLKKGQKLKVEYQD